MSWLTHSFHQVAVIEAMPAMKEMKPDSVPERQLSFLMGAREINLVGNLGNFPDSNELDISNIAFYA